jgi:hypothetical protein
MAEDSSNNWLSDRLDALRNIVTSVTGVVLAVAALATAVIGLWHLWPASTPATATVTVTQSDKCKSPYVWREATPDDHVCVTQATHEKTLQDNSLAPTRRDPKGGGYGADTCLSGYVWRDSFEGDHICVTPDIRDQAAADNRDAANRTER